MIVASRSLEPPALPDGVVCVRRGGAHTAPLAHCSVMSSFQQSGRRPALRRPGCKWLALSRAKDAGTHPVQLSERLTKRGMLPIIALSYASRRNPQSWMSAAISSSFPSILSRQVNSVVALAHLCGCHPSCAMPNRQSKGGNARAVHTQSNARLLLLSVRPVVRPAHLLHHILAGGDP